MMSDHQFDDEIDLGELLQTLLGQWRIVVSTLVASVALSGLYAFVIAPTQYKAEAVVRGLPQNFCPAAITCSMSLEASLSKAAGMVTTRAGFEAVDAAVNLSSDDYFFSTEGPNSAVLGQRRFFDNVNVTVNAARATVAVTHESDVQAVEIANAVIGFIQSQIAEDTEKNLEDAKRVLLLRLSTLSSATQTLSQSDGVITLERGSLQAQIEGIDDVRSMGLASSVVDSRADFPVESIAPRRSLILALGAVLGLFLGAGAAIAYSVRRGNLHSQNAIAAAFGDRDAVSGSETEILAQSAQGLWQQVRVAIGDGIPPVIAIAGHVQSDTLKHAALGLHAEFARSGKKAAIVDLGQWFPLQAPTSDRGAGVGLADVGDAVPAYACDAGALKDLVTSLAQDGTIAIVLPPSAERDLPLMRDAFLCASARIFLARRGNITRKDVGRFLLAERGSEGRRVVAVV